MPHRVNPDHITAVRKSIIAAERSNDRSIGDLSRCMTAMVEQRTASRTILNSDAISAIRKICRSIDLSLAAQQELADAHGILTALPERLELPYGPGCGLTEDDGGRVVSITAA